MKEKDLEAEGPHLGIKNRNTLDKNYYINVAR
jgi:hypothetical protein